jgi:hypothetical protein
MFGAQKENFVMSALKFKAGLKLQMQAVNASTDIPSVTPQFN